MEEGRSLQKNGDLWLRLVGGFFLLIFVIAFWNEFLVGFKVVEGVFQHILGLPVIDLPADTPQALLSLLINLVTFAVIYFAVLGWVSYFILPARNGQERQKVFGRLIDAVMGWHGPAVFVKNGEMVAREDEKIDNEGVKGRFAQLALVDISSAIVLESRTLPPIINLPMKTSQKSELRSPVRVLGPGIGFLRSGERIGGCVDLRKQLRTLKNVHGFTSDGIELVTNVNVVFTLGQAPDVMRVFKDDSSSLRSLTINPVTNKITSCDEIEKADTKEILASLPMRSAGSSGTKADVVRNYDRPPYLFDEEHVISAIISQPRNTRDGKLEQWTELPARIAVSTLLDELSRFSYDQLYSLDSAEPVSYLHKTFKPEFRWTMKSSGVLAWQFVKRKDGIIPQAGDAFDPEEYILWEVVELKNSKPIRDRGIKVIEAGFSEFAATNDTIAAQRFETWRSEWQKKTELSLAQYDYEIMRQMNHERAEAQREIIFNLAQIFKLPGFTQDALAIRIFQALETAAANPATNRLLPRDTVNMLRSFQNILFPQGQTGRLPGQNPYGEDDDAPAGGSG